MHAGHVDDRAPTIARRAWRPRHWALFATWGIFSAVLGAIYVRVPPNPDAAVFDYIGWMQLKGARLYIDVGEQNFPGQMWLQAASTALFGNHVWSFRVFDYLLTLLGGGALLGLLRRAGLRLAGYLVVPLYQAMIVTAGIWVSGQRDVTAALFLAGAGLAYDVRRGGRGLRWLVAFAALTCGAVLIRPTYALFAPLLLVGDFIAVRADDGTRRRILGDAAAAGGVCLLVLGAVVFAFWRTGALSAWYEMAVLYNREVYSQDHTLLEITLSFLGMINSWKWYLAFGVLGAWLWRRDGVDRGVRRVLVAILLTSVGSGYVQGKGFGYHIGGLLPPLAAFGAFFLARSIEKVRAGFTRPRLVVAALACSVAVGGIGKKLWNERALQFAYYAGTQSEAEVLSHYAAGPIGFSVADAVEAADYVRRTTLPDATVLTWSRALHVNYLAGRASPLRFPTVGMLIAAREPFSRARAWTEETERVFATRPPAVVLVPIRGAGEGELDVWGAGNRSGCVLAVRDALERRYAFERSFGNMELFRLRN